MDEREEPVSHEQAAARGEDAPEELQEETDEGSDEGTENPLFDTEQHSDAPGPFGTG